VYVQGSLVQFVDNSIYGFGFGPRRIGSPAATAGRYEQAPAPVAEGQPQYRAATDTCPDRQYAVLLENAPAGRFANLGAAPAAKSFKLFARPLHFQHGNIHRETAVIVCRDTHAS
jgi:hypothetical protein